MYEKLHDVAVVAEQGLRESMEDTYTLIPDFANRGWLFGGIYDGHGGKSVAAFASENLYRLVEDKIQAGFSPQQAFKTSYKTVSENSKGIHTGTTAVTFLVTDTCIITANVGDSRAILVAKRRIQQLTKDHRIENESERNRVLSSGGEIMPPYVYFKGRGLMPTRSLGDHFFERAGIISTPAVKSHKININDLLLIAASDGLWDLLTNEEVAALARKYSEPGKLLAVLRDEVLIQRRGTDNLTVIAIRIG